MQSYLEVLRVILHFSAISTGGLKREQSVCVIWAGTKQLAQFGLQRTLAFMEKKERRGEGRGRAFTEQLFVYF